MSEPYDMQASGLETSETTESSFRPLDLGRCLNEAIDVWKENWLTLALAAFLFTAISFVSLLILAGPLCAGICIMTLETMRRGDKEIVLGEMFREFNLVNVYGRFLPFVGLFFLTVAGVILGLSLLIVPGLLLMTFWSYGFFLMVDKGLPVFAALRVSKDIVTYKGFWPNLLLMLICVAIEVGTSTIPYVGVFLGFFISPIAWLMVSSAYIQLVDEDSGLLQNLIQAEKACTQVGL